MDIILSLIIPVYNTEKYLPQLFDSIDSQSLKKLEIIFVDDGSTDNSFLLLKRYKETRENVTVIYQKNMGGSIARNTGLSVSKGKYIYFFDSDDMLNTNVLNDLIKQLNDSQADILIGNVKTINEKGIVKIKPPVFKKDISDNAHKLFFYDSNPGNKIFKADIIKNNGIKFDDVRIVQDLNFYLKYIPFCSKVCYSETTMYYYLIRENSVSNTYGTYIMDVVKSVKAVRKYYIKKRVADKYRKELEYNLVKHLIFQFYKIPHIKSIKNRIIIIRYFYRILKSIDLNKNQYIKLNMKEEIDNFYKKRIEYIIKV